MRSFLIAVSMIAISSVAASAASKPVVATLAAAAKEKSFVAGNVVWRCDGTSCATASVVNDGPKSLCRDLARKVGEVATFEGLDAEQLTKCNASKRN
jgi:hypothetical protein